jgi:hypothetical protein
MQKVMLIMRIISDIKEFDLDEEDVNTFDISN